MHVEFHPVDLKNLEKGILPFDPREIHAIDLVHQSRFDEARALFHDVVHDKPSSKNRVFVNHLSAIEDMDKTRPRNHRQMKPPHRLLLASYRADFVKLAQELRIFRQTSLVEPPR